MIVIILLIVAIIVFLSVIQPQPLENKSRQQEADSGFFSYSDHGSHHDGCGSDGGFSDSGCGGGGD
ncbi:hypothetical protein MOC78_14170 [Bacillus inaquosorum]|uniref:hypothetical protein n=1 Tax=Bacillus inaquosorum TaxID=483913 RepID=UPI0022825B66|nr:hypothetical protein [Bacillus inaquosorum]MCY8137729.1 hypothetical protein [Bacillus inaquosorum]MCY8274240.1 hypothetical protein [Bacillus inaquosorum]MCY8388602.1 hypothetical protein [Bacillus inaquosorum]MCY9298415.1 hypothetical protein [Bacillus inaquosorum]